MDPNAVVSQDTLHQYRPLQPGVAAAGDFIINACVPRTRACVPLTGQTVFQPANGIANGLATPNLNIQNNKKPKANSKNAAKTKTNAKANANAKKKPDQKKPAKK